MSEPAAVLVLERVVRNDATLPGVEPTITILQTLGGRDLDQGRPEKGRKRFRAYYDFQEKALVTKQGNAEVQSYWRRWLLLRVAAAFADRGMVPDTLELMARYADIPPTRYQESPPNGTIVALTRSMASLAPVERYQLLKEWTLLKAERKGLRSLVGYHSDTNIPPSVFGVSSVIPPGGVIATPALLIEAAIAAGRVDELAGELRAIDGSVVEEARPLLALVEIARGKRSEIGAIVNGFSSEIKKPGKSTTRLIRPSSNGKPSLFRTHP